MDLVAQHASTRADSPILVEGEVLRARVDCAKVG